MKVSHGRGGERDSTAPEDHRPRGIATVPRKRLRRNPNGAIMVRMVARLCVVLSCLLLALLGGCSSGSQATNSPDAPTVTGGSSGSAGTGEGPGGAGGGGGTGGQLSTTTSATPPRCVPDASVACACVDGQQGAQMCTSAGTFAACVCPAPTGGAGGAGGRDHGGTGGGNAGSGGRGGAGGSAQDAYSPATVSLSVSGNVYCDGSQFKISVANAGGSATGAISIRATGDLVVRADSCSGYPLAVGASCSLTFSYATGTYRTDAGSGGVSVLDSTGTLAALPLPCQNVVPLAGPDAGPVSGPDAQSAADALVCPIGSYTIHYSGTEYCEPYQDAGSDIGMGQPDSVNGEAGGTVAVWTQIQTSAPTLPWKAVASSADGTKLIAVVGAVSVGTTGPIYTSGDSGVTWTQTSAPQQGWSSVASSADGSKLVAVADGCIYTSGDSGVTWTKRSASQNSWTSVASSADGTKLVAAFSGGFGGYVSTSADSGTTWTQTSATMQEWTSVASSADGTVLVAAAAYSSYAPPSSGLIYTSRDSGATWTPGGSTPDGWNSVALSADGIDFVAAAQFGGSGAIGDGYIYTERQRGPQDIWTSVASSADGSRRFATANDYIYISEDFGTTWTQTGINQYWRSVASSVDGSKLVAIGCPSYPACNIYTLH